MNRKWILAAAAFGLLAAAPTLAKTPDYAAAIGDSARPDADKQLDAERKPREPEGRFRRSVRNREHFALGPLRRWRKSDRATPLSFCIAFAQLG